MGKVWRRSLAILTQARDVLDADLKQIRAHFPQLQACR
jgi:hypothetical protein